MEAIKGLFMPRGSLWAGTNDSACATGPETAATETPGLTIATEAGDLGTIPGSLVAIAARNPASSAT